jgi:SNF2 family DNA or RNA helicase
MSIELFPWQPEGVEFLRSRKTGLLADQQGLGKTIMSLFATRELPGPGIIISRPLNKPYWRVMIRLIDPEAEIATAVSGGVYNEKKVASWFYPKRKRGYLIIHHEMLSTPKNSTRNIPQKLRKYGYWDFVVADEAHRFKNRKAQQTQGLKRILTWRKYALTGTPMEKHPADFWSILNWFNPVSFSNYWGFFEDFVEYYDKPFGGRKILGPRNEVAFAKTVAPYYLRRERTQIPNFPEKLPPQIIPLELLPQQQELYDDLRRKVLVEIEEGVADSEMFIPNSMARLHRLKQAALDPSLLGSGAKSVKVEWLVDWVKDYPDTPSVVFTQSREFANGLPYLLDGGATISGDVRQELRDQRIQDFMSGKLRYIVGTIDTMSESINLQRASVAIFTDLHRSATAMSQAADRIHRADSPGPVQHIYLLGKDTVDELFWDALEKKFSDIETIHAFLAKEKERSDGQGRVEASG